jgi:hypothetical protein
MVKIHLAGGAPIILAVGPRGKVGFWYFMNKNSIPILESSSVPIFLKKCFILN